jgi:hypothetical protein
MSHTIKEIADKINAADKCDAQFAPILFNKIRNLDTQIRFKTLDLEKRGPALSARARVMYDDIGMARIRIATKLADVGIPARVLRDVNGILTDESVSQAIKGESNYFHFILWRDPNGFMGHHCEISNSENYQGTFNEGEVIHAELRLPLKTLFDGLF